MQMKKWQEDEWWVLSRKFVEHCKLPNGSKVVLRSARSGRVVRRDRVFKYRPFEEEAQEDWTAARLLDTLEASLTADLRLRRIDLELVGPNGETPDGGETLAALRRWPPRKAVSATELRRLHEATVEEVASLTERNMKAVEARREPNAVCTGYLLALVRRFGRAEVEAALNALPAAQLS